jgi:hypothetical protein
MKPAAITANEIAASAKARIRKLARNNSLRAIADELGVTTEEAYRQCLWAEELPNNHHAHRVPDLQGQYTGQELSARWRLPHGEVRTIVSALRRGGFPVAVKQRPTYSMNPTVEQIEEWAALRRTVHLQSDFAKLLGVCRNTAGKLDLLILKHLRATEKSRLADDATEAPEPEPIAMPEPEPVLTLTWTQHPCTGPSDYVRARMAAMPVAPHSPAVQAILDRLYGVAA